METYEKLSLQKMLKRMKATRLQKKELTKTMNENKSKSLFTISSVNKNFQIKTGGK